MISITKAFEWDMGHRVTNHNSLCKNPHGHRYKMIVELSGEIIQKDGAPDQGMVADFGAIKKLVQTIVVDVYDHSFVYWDKDAIMQAFAKVNKSLRMHSLRYVPTAENLAEDFAKRINAEFNSKMPGVELVSIQLFETPNSSAIWRSNG